MKSLIDIIRLHGTKILGFIGVTLGVLAVADPALVGGELAIKYYLLGISLLNVWRGFFTSDAFKVGLVVKEENASRADAIMKDQRANSHWFAAALAFMVTILLLGCAAIPNSLSARAAAAYTALSVTNDTATVLTNANVVTKTHAGEVLDKTRLARQAVDAANNLTELETALDMIRLAQDVLCGPTPKDPNCVLMKQRTNL